MHHFTFSENELYCEQVPVRRIAETADTPFYLYSKRTLVENFRRSDNAFKGIEHLICFALKANSNPALLSLLAQEGAGADVVSAGEIALALQSGFPPEKILYAGVGKTDTEIRYALEQGILACNVESAEELRVINSIAAEMGVTAPVGLRINPDIDIHGHPYIATGKSDNKFGIAVSEAKQLIDGIGELAHVRLIGLHCHLGSQITETQPYIHALQLLIALQTELRDRGIVLQYLDMGGGLGVRYRNVFTQESSDTLSVEKLGAELRPYLQNTGCRIIFEPGRSLIAQAGALVTRVIFNKKTPGKHFVIVDAGMTELLRPSLYDAYHEIVPVQARSGPQQLVDVVGPICETGDFLAKERALPPVARGDLLAVMTAGAYGFSLSSNYNARPRPAEVLVDGREFHIIREREKLDQIWR